jgi:hypothetical protein
MTIQPASDDGNLGRQDNVLKAGKISVVHCAISDGITIPGETQGSVYDFNLTTQATAETERHEICHSTARNSLVLHASGAISV